MFFLTYKTTAHFPHSYTVAHFPSEKKGNYIKYTFLPIIVQQDATIYSSLISVNRSTCFGWYLHPSSGAHVTVSSVYLARK